MELWHSSTLLFCSTFALIFAAELPDKTWFASLVLATRYRAQPVLLGISAAFFVQCLIAVMLGRLFGALPAGLVHVASGVMFLVFAAVLWYRPFVSESGDQRVAQAGYWASAWASFLCIFMAEWGDLTQFATAALQARYQSPGLILVASTLALVSVGAIAIFIGNRVRDVLRPAVLQRLAATGMAVVGVVILLQAIF